MPQPKPRGEGARLRTGTVTPRWLGQLYGLHLGLATHPGRWLL